METPPKGYVCYRATKPIKIDGDLRKAEWLRAPWTDDFVDIEGDAKPKPRFRTRAKMLWDDEFFYIAAEMEEPHVWATLTDHDSVIFHDNDFEVFIDPDGDNHQYYEFEINALNTTWDLRLVKPYRDGGPALNEWEIPGMKHAVRVDGTLNEPRDKDRGWTVELAFPWKVLKEFANRPAPPRDGDHWRVNFSRVEWQIEPPSSKWLVFEEGERGVETVPESVERSVLSVESSLAEGRLEAGPDSGSLAPQDWTQRQSPYRKVPNTPEDNWVWSPQGVVDMHRPERWGYVQFSTATHGPVPFLPDPEWPARETVHRVYYAQKAFKEKHGHWALHLADLDLEALSDVRLLTTADGFEAWIVLDLPGGRRTITIRQDSRITTRQA